MPRDGYAGSGRRRLPDARARAPARGGARHPPPRRAVVDTREVHDPHARQDQGPAVVYHALQVPLPRGVVPADPGGVARNSRRWSAVSTASISIGAKSPTWPTISWPRSPRAVTGTGARRRGPCGPGSGASRPEPITAQVCRPGRAGPDRGRLPSCRSGRGRSE